MLWIFVTLAHIFSDWRVRNQKNSQLVKSLVKTSFGKPWGFGEIPKNSGAPIASNCHRNVWTPISGPHSVAELCWTVLNYAELCWTLHFLNDLPLIFLAPDLDWAAEAFRLHCPTWTIAGVKLHLVGGCIPTPLKNVISSIGMISNPIYGKIKNCNKPPTSYWVPPWLWKAPKIIDVPIDQCHSAVVLEAADQERNRLIGIAFDLKQDDVNVMYKAN